MIDMDKMQKLRKMLIKRHEAALIVRKHSNQANGIKVDAKADRLIEGLAHLKSSSAEMVAQEQISEYEHMMLDGYNAAKLWLSLTPQEQTREAEHIALIEQRDNPDIMVSDIIQAKTNDAKEVISYYDNTYSSMSNEQKFNEIFRRESIVFDLVLSELVKYSIADVMKLQPDDISINLEPDVLVAVADLSRPKLKRILKQVVGEVNTSRGLANLIENSSKFIKPGFIIALLGCAAGVVGGGIHNDLLSDIGSTTLIAGGAMGMLGVTLSMFDKYLTTDLNTSMPTLMSDIEKALKRGVAPTIETEKER